MRKAIIVNLVVLLLICAWIPEVARAPPPLPPCVFYGYVYTGGRPAKDGLNVTAVISGTSLKWSTETKNGTYGWPLKGSTYLEIPSDDTETAEKDGGVTGNHIEFYVDGVHSTGQTATFDSGGVVRTDISIPGNATKKSLITVTLDCSTTYSGYKVEISGELTDENGAGISGTGLLATYATSGASWKDIAFFNTTVSGSYHIEWTPTASAENYTIKISWEGDENFERSEATTNLAITPLEQMYAFSVMSNSTISELTFDSANKILSFTVEGPPDTTGYTSVTIAKELIPELGQLKVFLDGNQTTYTATSTNTSWRLYLTYQHSSHKVKINLTTPTVPFFETPLGIATLSAVAIALALIIAFSVRRHRHAQKPATAKSRPT
jgi:hypothetical protein